MLPGGAPEYMVGERTALCPLGFGLSYTQFEYRDLEVDVADETSCRVDVRVKVCHVGSRVGTETVQRRSSRVISASLSAKQRRFFYRISLGAQPYILRKARKKAV